MALCSAFVGCGDNLAHFAPQDPILITSSDDLFTGRHVVDIWIELGSESRARLVNEPREYVAGDVTISGEEVRGVGIRLKGTFSFRGLGGKAAFKLKFNWTESGVRFFGLEGLTLNNMVQDRALVHEWLGYRVFRAAGVPAPRSGYARVFVNQEPYGLYALVESVDDSFLARNFADPTGNLYEEHRFSDLHPDDVWRFEQDEGDDTSRRDLHSLIEAANQPGDGVFTSGILDTREFLAFLAAEIAVGHWDGYYKAHNYRIYHEPTLDQWSFLPWGTDQVLERELDAFGGTGMLSRKCFRSNTCLALYNEVALEVLGIYESLDLAAELDRIAATIEPLADEDPRKPYSMAKYHRHQKQARAFVTEQPTRLRQRIDCFEDGVEADRDGDGYGACRLDCNDHSEFARPGGVEICDGLDNDCNGYIDELDSCPCPEFELDGVLFLLCANPLPWTMARGHCAAQHADLAWIDNDEQNAALFAATQRAAQAEWYIGLNDQENEGQHVWTSGVAADYVNWAVGDPDNHGTENCAVIDRFAGGGWTDVYCWRSLPFLCRR
ncbi:MAG: CotH kinase family protein [Proteobacteria bacterium]|nr:CotH kinase family protein [Pseudomonadota bacterium]